MSYEDEGAGQIGDKKKHASDSFSHAMVFDSLFPKACPMIHVLMRAKAPRSVHFCPCNFSMNHTCSGKPPS